jgi:hypothetical protein
VAGACDDEARGLLQPEDPRREGGRDLADRVADHAAGPDSLLPQRGEAGGLHGEEQRLRDGRGVQPDRTLPDAGERRPAEERRERRIRLPQSPAEGGRGGQRTARHARPLRPVAAEDEDRCAAGHGDAQ